MKPVRREFERMNEPGGGKTFTAAVTVRRREPQTEQSSPIWLMTGEMWGRASGDGLGKEEGTQTGWE